MQKIIKIGFVGFWKGFDFYNNDIVNTLKKQYSVQISDHPEFLFVSCFDHNFTQYSNCVKIYVGTEVAAPDFNIFDYAMSWDPMFFGERYFQLKQFPTIEEYDRIFSRPRTELDAVKPRFCNFIYSQKTTGEGAVLREKFCKELMKYKHVDCPGIVLNNMKGDISERHVGNWEESKKAFIRDYKFTIAFENTSYPGYTTEKMLDPLLVGSLPIYWGNTLVGDDFDAAAFIDCTKYKDDIEAMVKKVIEYDQNDELYTSALRTLPIAREDVVRYWEGWDKFLTNIIENGVIPFNKNPNKVAMSAAFLELCIDYPGEFWRRKSYKIMVKIWSVVYKFEETLLGKQLRKIYRTIRRK